MTITIVALVCAVSAALVLSFGKFAKSDSWRATVTPLASIIGSGFLICVVAALAGAPAEG